MSGILRQQHQQRGIRHQVMLYLMAAAAALIGLLWLFQMVLLDDFYRWNKTMQLRQAADIVAENADNAELKTLISHLANRSDICIMLLDEQEKLVAASEDIRYCLIHRMSRTSRSFWCAQAPEDGSALMELFDVAGPQEGPVNPRHFRGRIPQEIGEQQALLCVRRVTLSDGRGGYLLLNTIITPLDATLETLRMQLIVIALAAAAGAAMLAWGLSRRVARPIIETNEAARTLAQGQYAPPAHGHEYREMAELNETLVHAAHELSQVERLQHELIANISHDLRTPLTMIGGYAEAMRDIPGEASPENMQIIIDESSRLTSLVTELLDFSRLQTGSTPMELAPFDLTDAVETIVQRVARMTEKDGYSLRFEPAQHVMVLADEKRIGQVVYNLLGNALTYTGEDKTVYVTQSVQNGQVRIAVSDTGKGIPAEELPLIWNRYYRSKESHRRAVIGSGLGLSIVQSILEKHGAAYGVESAVGKGTTFWFACEQAENAATEA